MRAGRARGRGSGHSAEKPLGSCGTGTSGVAQSPAAARRGPRRLTPEPDRRPSPWPTWPPPPQRSQLFKVSRGPWERAWSSGPRDPLPVPFTKGTEAPCSHPLLHTACVTTLAPLPLPGPPPPALSSSPLCLPGGPGWQGPHGAQACTLEVRYLGPHPPQDAGRGQDGPSQRRGLRSKDRVTSASSHKAWLARVQLSSFPPWTGLGCGQLPMLTSATTSQVKAGEEPWRPLAHHPDGAQRPAPAPPRPPSPLTPQGLPRLPTEEPAAPQPEEGCPCLHPTCAKRQAALS